MKRKKITVFLGVGSNLGARLQNIEGAVQAFQDHPDIKLIGVSPIYETDPVGGPRQPRFLNGVLRVTTHLKPTVLLKNLQRLEMKMGRRKKKRWGPRVIDLDILFYGDLKSRSRILTLPHPRLHKRHFVLAPLVDLAPGKVHPTLRKRASSLLRNLTGSGQKVTIQFRWKKSRFQGLSGKRKPAKKSPR